MRRFFTEPQNIEGTTAHILEDAAHITRVLRLEPGTEILLFDGTGYEYTAQLTQLGSRECLAKITGKTFSEQEPGIQVTIFQGIPKSGKMEAIIQKSVELVSPPLFQPLWTAVSQSLIREKNRWIS